jgi:mannose-6-phosphate isomerase
MANLELKSPIVFQPIFQERIWGGRKLAEMYGKKLPPNVRIGESWEIADRPDAQSVVINGSFKGETLHQLWTQQRQEIFGGVKDAPRFPLLIKLLDAQEKLSLQVHPPDEIALKLGGEPKTEFWYVAAAEPDAELFVGFCKPTSREDFKAAIEQGSVADCVHAIQVRAGDAMFLPSGRFHAIGAGNLLVEVQQNSDTTYRVFDWNRVDDSGKPRQLHVNEAIESIDYNDIKPKLAERRAEVIVQHDLFEIEEWRLDRARQAAPIGQFAIVFCVSGKITCAGVELAPGHFFLIPASLQDRELHPHADDTTLLRVTIPR